MASIETGSPLPASVFDKERMAGIEVSGALESGTEGKVGAAVPAQASEIDPKASTAEISSFFRVKDPAELMQVFTILESLFRHRPEHPGHE